MFDKIKYDSMLVLISYFSRLHSGTVLAQITEILFKNKIDFAYKKSYSKITGF